MKRFAILLWAASLAISIPLVLGFFGAAHPAFDAMAHFRAHLAVLLALAAIGLLAMRGQRAVGAAALACTAAKRCGSLGPTANAP